MINRSAFCSNLIFSLATRERCIANLKRYRVPKPNNAEAPRGSMLIPLCVIENRPSLLYTIRSPDLRIHTGQVSFPGGKMESSETPIQAALRETQNQIGISATKIDLWGQGPAVPGKNQRVLITPVVGNIVDLKKEDIIVNKKEVSEVFAVSLETLCDPNNQFYTQFKNGYISPVFVADEYKIWGITAFLTHAFLECLLPRRIYLNDWNKKKIELKEDCEELQLEA